MATASSQEDVTARIEGRSGGEIPGWSFASLTWFDSSQGETGETDVPRCGQRRMRRTGNPSIHLFLFLALGFVSCTPVLAKPAPLSKVEQVGNDFEALMLNFYFEQMAKSQGIESDDPNNPFAPSSGEKIFRAMQRESMLKNLATGRPLGYGDLVVRQLKGQSGIPQGIRKAKTLSVNDSRKVSGGR